MVELRMECRLILLAAGDEQGVLGGQKCPDGVLALHLTAVRLQPGPPVVRVDGLVPTGDQLSNDARLPSARHPREKNPLHVGERTSRTPGSLTKGLPSTRRPIEDASRATGRVGRTAVAACAVGWVGR